MNVIINGIKTEIDDYCVNSILLLNAKGYLTSDCCSGHVKNKRSNDKQFPYIGFNIEYMPKYIPSFIKNVSEYDGTNKKRNLF